MASFLKEMETIIKENEKLKKENQGLKEYNEELKEENEELEGVKDRYHGDLLDCLEFIVGDKELTDKVRGLVREHYIPSSLFCGDGRHYGREEYSKQNDDLWEMVGSFESILERNNQLRVQLNIKNRELNESKSSLDKIKKDKISRGEKIGSLMDEIHKLKNKDIIQIMEMEKNEMKKQEIENKWKHYREVTERTTKESREIHKNLNTELSKYRMGINQQDQLKKWFDKNCGSFNYRLGKELHDIIS